MHTNYQAILQRSKSMDDFHGSLLLVSTIYELQNYLRKQTVIKNMMKLINTLIYYWFMYKSINNVLRVCCESN